MICYIPLPIHRRHALQVLSGTNSREQGGIFQPNKSTDKIYLALELSSNPMENSGQFIKAPIPSQFFPYFDYVKCRINLLLLPLLTTVLWTPHE